STNYQTPGQRVQYTCSRANGQPYSAIEVVAGTYAWNEDIAGAEIIAGKGKATPMPATVQERLVRLWASPQGAPNAALLAAGKTTEKTNGVVARDLTTTETETGSVYVVLPVPASVKKAMPNASLAAANKGPDLAAGTEQTPRLASGKPDMTGNWNSSGMNWR